MGKDRAFLNRIGHAPEPVRRQGTAVVTAAHTHPVRISNQTLPVGARVRYGCSPPLVGVVVRRDGGSHWVEFPVFGVLRCNTFDLKVLREGE